MQDVVYFVNHNLVLSLCWGLVIVLLFAIELRIRKFGPKKLSTLELVDLINNQNAFLYDLRAPVEFNKGHISQALNFHLTNNANNSYKELLQDLLRKLTDKKDKPVILVCKDGILSSSIALALKKQNITNIGYLNGGMNDWLIEKLPTVG